MAVSREVASHQGQQEIVDAINGFTLSGVTQKAVWFDSVSSMQRADIPAGATAATRGYTTVNDGGNAFYYIREKTVSDVEDGGSIIFLDNENVAELIAERTINAKQFGAYGDETHDDTDAINAASLYLASNGGGELFFPKGKYCFTRLILRQNVAFIGESKTSTFLKCTDGTTEDATGLGFGSALRKLDDGNGIGYVSIKHMAIGTALSNVGVAQDNFPNLIALNLAGCNHCTVEDVSFGGCGYGAIVLAQCARGAEGLGFTNTQSDGNYNYFANLNFAACGKYNPDTAVVWMKYKANGSKFYGTTFRGCSGAIAYVVKYGDENFICGGSVESCAGIVSISTGDNTVICLRGEGITGDAYTLLNNCTGNKIIVTTLTGVAGQRYNISNAPNNIIIRGSDINNFRTFDFPPLSNYAASHNHGMFKVSSICGDADFPLYVKSETQADTTKYPTVVMWNDLIAPPKGQILGRIAFRNGDTTGTEKGISATIDAVTDYNHTGNTDLAFCTGNGSTLEQRLILGFNGHLYPATDNAYNLGKATNRWATVFAGTGTINTSDEREKQDIAPIEDAVFRAWAKVDYVKFRFKDAVAKKGETARIHFGLIAQQVKEAFESEGLDAFRYGLLCYDEWEEETETDEDGNMTIVKEAGNRYGIRYDEALALECAYQRWLNKKA